MTNEAFTAESAETSETNVPQAEAGAEDTLQLIGRCPGRC